MPRLEVSNKEWEMIRELMAAGSVFIIHGTWEWKQYEELRVKLKKQVEG